MSKLFAVVFALLLSLSSCIAPEGGDPRVSLPSLEQMSQPQFEEVCLHVKVFTQDSVALLIESKKISSDRIGELGAMMGGIVADPGLLNDPHPFTRWIEASGPEGKRLLSVVLLAEDLIRLHWDLGPVGVPLTDRSRRLLQAIVDGLKDAAIITAAPSSTQA